MFVLCLLQVVHNLVVTLADSFSLDYCVHAHSIFLQREQARRCEAIRPRQREREMWHAVFCVINTFVIFPHRF